MDQSYRYDLAFLAPQRRPRTAPEIIFTIDKSHLAETERRVQAVVELQQADTDGCLDTRHTHFTLPTQDLFGNREFGYGRCGYVTVEQEKVHFRIQLGPGVRKHQCSRTILALTHALGFPFAHPPQGSRCQQVELTVQVGQNNVRYVHAVGGLLSVTVMRWLQGYAAGKVQKVGIIDAAPMHPAIISAMQSAWYAVSDPDRRHWASHICGFVRSEGHFSLKCFGDACDLSVYPDQRIEFGRAFVSLASHNLDLADQQLTLLAGLAKLCALARESS